MEYWADGDEAVRACGSFERLQVLVDDQEIETRVVDDVLELLINSDSVQLGHYETRSNELLLDEYAREHPDDPEVQLYLASRA